MCRKEACSLVSGAISSRGHVVCNQPARVRVLGVLGKTGNSSNKRQIMSVREGLAAEKGQFQLLESLRQGLAKD